MFKRFLVLATALILALSAAVQATAAGPAVQPLKLDDCGLAAHWAAPYACDLIHQGVIEAKGLNLNAPVTEAEFRALIHKATGSWPGVGDIAADRHLTREEALRMLGITLGFRLDEVDTRVLAPFKDAAELSDTARRTAAFMLLHGIVQGRAAGVLAPEATVTLGEALKLIQTAVPERLQPGQDKVSLLLFNDFHGHLIQDSRKRAGNDIGMSVLTTAISGQLLKNPNTILIDGGDSYQGTPISNLVKGESTLQWKNYLGVEAAIIGNHEFDWSTDVLQTLIKQSEHPVLSANIFVEATGERPAWAKPSAMLEVGGYKVGIIGITTPETKSIVVQQYVEGLEFRDPVPVIESEAKSLRAAGADLVIVAFHASLSPGKSDPFQAENEVADWMKQVTQRIDAVTGAHSHEKTAGYVLDAAGNRIPAIQAASYGRALGRIDLYMDESTGAVVKAIPHVWEPAQTLAATPWATDVLAAWQAKVKPIESVPVGKLAAPLLRRYNQAGESPLGDFIADSMLTAGQGVQIAIMNGGGIRADLEGENGTVTWGHLYTVEPFGNTLVTVEMTGAQLRLLLEQGVDSYIKQIKNLPGAHGPMQVAGISFTWDFAKPMGERVDPALLKLADGTTVDSAATYKVIVNNFMAGGGDDLAILRELKAKQVDLGVIDLDVFVEYFKAKTAEKPLEYQLQNRIQVLNYPAN